MAMRGDSTLKRIAMVLGAGLASQLAACSTSSLLDSELPASTNYVIAPLPPAPNATQSAASQTDIAIGRPDVAPGLDTSRIAVLRGRQLDYYRGVQWGGNTLEVVQSLLVSSLQDQKLFRSVTSEQARVAGAYMLDSEVRDFQAEYTDGKDAPAVQVTIIGRLIRIADRALVDTISATATRDAADNRMNAVAAAFEAAAHQVAQSLARDIAAAVARDSERILAIPTPPSPTPPQEPASEPR
jgi:cholesterol transport system auxiliary component